MILGLSRPTSGSVEVFGMEPRTGDRPRPGGGGDADRWPAQGPHRCARPWSTPRACSRTPSRSRRCWPVPGSPRSPTAGWRSARAASSSGCGSRWPCSPTRRCCSSTSRPPAWTSRDGARSGGRSAGRGAGPLGAVRDALPRGGRPVRRPDHPGQQRPDRRRRQRQRDQGARRRAHGAGHAAQSRRLGPVRLGGVDSVEVRGDQVYVHAKDSDTVARYLLTQTDARDLEIIARGLEDAFLSLTGRPTRRRPRPQETRRSTPMSTPVDPTDAPGAAVRRLQRHPDAHRAQAGCCATDARFSSR